MKKTDNEFYEEYIEFYNKIKKPKYLYKFFSLGEYDFEEIISSNSTEIPKLSELDESKLNSILKNDTWLSSPQCLNDPFEFRAFYNSTDKEDEGRYNAAYIRNLINYNTYVVSCFTTSYNNIPMWGHYGKGSTGFCIKYKVINDEKLYPVFYTEDRFASRLFDCVHHNITPEREQLLKLSYCVKQKLWNYENEWRVLEKKSGEDKNGMLVSNKDLGIEIDSIIVGLQCSDTTINILKAVAYNLKNVKLYEVILDHERYSLIKNEIQI